MAAETRRGTLIAHGFHAPAELETLRSQGRAEDAAPAVSQAPPAGGTQLAALQEELQQARMIVEQKERSSDILKKGQEEHHRKMNFQEEFLALLKKHQVAHDERYLWE